ncbi:hypothetical protein HDU76_003910 [Blyttiomyces sp. JEL0837]|nr:hypothetical protein HDU76_003910 [Blyttiomyces sp. JEL0837]
MWALLRIVLRMSMAPKLYRNKSMQPKDLDSNVGSVNFWVSLSSIVVINLFDLAALLYTVWRLRQDSAKVSPHIVDYGEFVADRGGVASYDNDGSTNFEDSVPEATVSDDNGIEARKSEYSPAERTFGSVSVATGNVANRGPTGRLSAFSSGFGEKVTIIKHHMQSR